MQDHLNKQKYVLFICGGKWQKPWLEFLKNKGYKIVLVDPHSSSPCVPLADIYLQLDARDAPGILSSIRELQLDIEFVTSDQTDVSTLTVAVLTEALGLYGNPTKSVLLFSNKFENRKFLKANVEGHYPNFIKAYSAGEILDFFQKTKCDIIIKPVDAQSSRGIFKIDSPNLEHISTCFSEALSFSKEKYIIAEEFVQGHEITIEGICINRTHYTLAISSKKHFRQGIASELRYPAILHPEILARVTKFHNTLVQKTGLLFGITHAEYIINTEQNDFYLVEVACRGGGSLISSHITPWVSGYNVYDAFYKLSTKVPVSPPKKVLNKSAILLFFEFDSGQVEKIEGLNDARNLDGVLDIYLEFNIGSFLKNAKDDRSRQGYVIIFSETPPELDEKIKTVLDLVKVSVI